MNVKEVKNVHLCRINTREVEADEEIHATANHHSPNLEKEVKKEMVLKIGWLFMWSKG